MHIYCHIYVCVYIAIYVCVNIAIYIFVYIAMCAGYLAIERVSTVIRIIFKELYSTIQVEAKSMTASFLRRMFSRSSNSTGG